MVVRAGRVSLRSPRSCVANDPNPKCANPLDPRNSSSQVVHTDTAAVYVQPADPGHGIWDVNEQMWGDGLENATAVPPMTGFILSCERTALRACAFVSSRRPV